MKISKESLIKVFTDGFSHARPEDGDYISICEYMEGGMEMSYHVRPNDDYTNIVGVIKLYYRVLNHKEFLKSLNNIEASQPIGIRYYISFMPYVENSTRFDYETEKTDLNITHEISMNEFTKLSLMFKTTWDMFRKREIDTRNDAMNIKLEALSDTFGLDFFPKKRMVITEKTKTTIKLADKIAYGLAVER